MGRLPLKGVILNKNMNRASYLQSADDLLHLCSAEIQEAFNQVPIDESCRLLCFTLRVEGPPGETLSRKKNLYEALTLPEGGPSGTTL